MSREMKAYIKRPRISVDVHPEIRRRLRLVAVKKDMTVRQYVLEAIEDHLKEDLKGIEDGEHLLALTAKTDPVLAEVWDNRKDAEYDKL